MADISMTCPDCGKNFTVSEHVSTQTVPCPGCGRERPVTLGTKASELKLRGAGAPIKSPAPTGEPPPIQRETVQHAGATARPQGKRDRKGRVTYRDPQGKGLPPILVQWLIFLALGGLLLGLLIPSEGNPSFVQAYRIVRLVLFPALWIWAIVAAFQETTLQGVLCLLIPPYVLYYVLGRCDIYTLRGAFFAMLLAVGFELKYLPNQSVASYSQRAAQGIVDWGQNNIHRAGEMDIEKL